LAALSAVGGVSDGEYGHIIDHHDRATDEGPGHKSEDPQCGDRPKDADAAEGEAQSYKSKLAMKKDAQWELSRINRVVPITSKPERRDGMSTTCNHTHSLDDHATVQNLCNACAYVTEQGWLAPNCEAVQLRRKRPSTPYMLKGCTSILVPPLLRSSTYGNSEFPSVATAAKDLCC
jgi:hypothetical protein